MPLTAPSKQQGGLKRGSGFKQVEAVQAGEPAWYFAYGANMARTVLQRRGVMPLETVPAALAVSPAECIAFQHRGGFATLVSGASTATAAAAKLSHPRPHGVLYKLTDSDLALVRQSETGYKLKPVEVLTYDQRKLDAMAFVSDGTLLLANPLPPTSRYLQLLQQGAAEHELVQEYQRWLSNVPCAPELVPLGPEYFDTPSQKVAMLLISAVAMLALAFIMYF